MKTTTLATAAVALLHAGLAVAAPFNATRVAPLKRQCGAPVPAPPSSTEAPAPPPTEAPAPPPTEAPAPPSTEAPAPAPTEAPAPPPPSGGGSAGGKGPYFSVYADTGVDAASFPSADSLGDWNDLLLAFWLSAGVWDAAYIWTSLDEATRKSTIDAYHAAGKTIRVSLFGATEYPLLSGGDPVDIGNKVADFVKQYNLDGVDVDYEDSGSFENAAAGGEDFLITLTKTLREKLPSPQYVITHAPQAPYFTTASNYPNGAYLKVHKEVGDMIDFYNVQFYNQGAGYYEDCDGLFEKSPDFFKGTSVNEIAASGIPIEKIVIGKPGGPGDGNNGIMDPAAIGSCISSKGNKAGGVMAWQLSHAGADWIAKAKGGL